MSLFLIDDCQVPTNCSILFAAYVITPHTFSTFFGEKKERKNAFTLSKQAT